MYAKLVFRNAKRSVKDYLIYIVTMTICVTLFYSFLSISSRYYQPDIGSEYNFTLLSDGMKAMNAICDTTAKSETLSVKGCKVKITYAPADTDCLDAIQKLLQTTILRTAGHTAA